MNDLIRMLLDYGMARDNMHNWKAIMLLLEIVYQSQESRRFVVKQLREVYNLKLGDLLDSINSFQLANYAVELIVNCFPRKHESRSTIATAPQLWEDNNKLRRFFSHGLYPDGCKHGEDELIQFVLDRFGNFFTNFGEVKKAVYTIGKSSKSKCISKKASYLQVTHQSVYFWDGEGMFIELDPKSLEIARDLKDVLKMSILDRFTSAVSSPHTAWLVSLRKATCFQFTMMDIKAAEAIWNATKLPKISEVQTYISLQIPSSFDDGIIESSIQGNSENLGGCRNALPEEEGYNREQENFPMGQLGNIVATPDGSTSSFENENLVETIASSSEQPVTPKKQKLQGFNQSIEEDDQSPLVIAQKRKIIRATSKTLEVLREEFKKGNNRSSSEHKAEEMSGNNVTCPRKNNIELDVSNPKTVKSMEKTGTKKVTEIFKPMSKNDTSVLDDIFALPLPKKNGKKADKGRQSKLNNFKPIVYVTSQDVPAKSKLVSNSKNRVTVKRKIANSSDAPIKKRKRFENAEDAFALSETVKENVIENPEPKRQTRSSKKAEQEKEPGVVKRIDGKVVSSVKKLSHKVNMSLEQETPPDETKQKPSNYNITTNTSDSYSNTETKSADSTLPLHKSAMMDSSHTDMSMLLPPEKPQLPMFNASFTNQLQEQIYRSVLNFSNELTRKISIINTEMNKKIITQLSEKYKTMFKELQSNFQNDVDQIAGFVGEIKDMLHLPEHELVKVIRDKQFHQ